MGCRDRAIIAIARTAQCARRGRTARRTTNSTLFEQHNAIYVIIALDVTLPLGDANMTSMAGDEDRGVRQTCKILMRQQQLGGGALM